MHKVMIVDDDPVQCRLACEVVERAGFAPYVAHSGTQAMTLLEETPGIGAILLDLVMPEMDGMAVLEAMKRQGYAIPVIVMTAQSSLDTIVSAMRLGATDTGTDHRFAP
jgi:DNA-binding NtrC family response regulator